MVGGGAFNGDTFEWAKSIDMPNTIWAMLRADGSMLSFTQKKRVMTFATASFDFDRTAKSMSSLTGMKMRSIAYKEAGGGGGKGVPLLGSAISSTEIIREGSWQRIEDP